MLVNNPPVALTENFWMLGTQGYPLYLCRNGGEAAIFEGGIGAVAALVYWQMQQMGIEKPPIGQLIITHAHPDHVMAVPRFRQTFPGISVVASEIAAKTLAIEKAVAFFGQIDEALTGSLVKLGSITEAQRPKPLATRQIAIDRTIKDGETLAVGGKSFQVLATPGHSDCSLSFYEREAKILVISDATGYYMPERNAWWPCYFGDYGAYLGSIRRLAAIDAEILCLSHNGAVCGAEDVRAYFGGAIRATEEYHRRIVEQAKAGKSTRQIAEELGQEAYEQSPLLPVDFFQKNCSLLVKQSLKHEGITVEK